MDSIKFFNRYSKKIETEIVFGFTFLKWLYQSNLGKILRPLFNSKYFSLFYGNYKGNLGHSAINDFIEEYKIKSDEFQNSKGNSLVEDYKNFNDFFIRTFTEGARSFVDKVHILPAFCEGRYLGFDSLENIKNFPVKGEYINIQSLIQRDYPEFKKGPILICRLAPVDYHHFHFPDEGNIMESFRIEGNLNSVTPFSLKSNNDVFIKNERNISVLKTKHFSKLLYIEVGALTVGKIIQTYEGDIFKRGEVKGHFKFGASTVILIGEENSFKISSDIINNTKNEIETFIKLGDEVGSKIKCL